MISLLAALVAPSLAVEDPALVRWREAPLVCVAAPVLKLRAHGRADADEVGRVVYGDRVHVLDIGAASQVGDAYGRWLYVRIGRRVAWVHDAHLTTRCIEADLDGDGRAERATASWHGAELRVGIRDGASGRTQSVVALSRPAAASADELEVGFAVRPSVAGGVPLVQVDTLWTPCGWRAEHGLVSYVATEADPVARPRVALGWSEHGDYELELDSLDVALSPDHRTVRLWHLVRSGSGGVPDGSASAAVSSRWLHDGVYEAEGTSWTGWMVEPGWLGGELALE